MLMPTTDQWKHNASEALDKKNAWNEASINEAVELGCNLVSKYPNARFFGIGQSPAYIIDAMASYSNQKNLELTTKHVPFSGKYLLQTAEKWVWKLPAKDRCGLSQLEELFGYMDAQENKELYRKFLTPLGLSPEEIASNYTKNQQQTVVMDKLCHGGGFSSFCHFMFTWAQETGINENVFSKAFTPVGLVSKGFGLLENRPIIKIPKDGIYINCEFVEISESLRKAMDGGGSDSEDIRSVPHYPPKEWKREPKPLNSNNSKTIEALQKKLEERIKENIRKESISPEVKKEPTRKKFLSRIFSKALNL